MARGSTPGRPRALNREVKELIVEYATSERDVSRDALADKLDAIIAEKGFNPPSFETLKKYISDARTKSDSPEDLPWSLGICSKYKEYFPLEAITILIEFLKKYQDDLFEPMSIRYAKWIVRLTPIIKGIKKVHDEKFYDMMAKGMAWQYATSERISEILGDKYFDTSILDKKNLIDPKNDEDRITGYIDHLNENLEKQNKLKNRKKVSE